MCRGFPSSNSSSAAVKGEILSGSLGIGVWGNHGGSSWGVYGSTNTGIGIVGTASSPSGLAGQFNGRVSMSSDLTVAGKLFVNNAGNFVGVGRSTPVTGNEVFGIRTVTASDFGGMYSETTGTSRAPFYGYATNGTFRAYHYYDGITGGWVVNNGAGDRMTVQSDGKVGIGTLTPGFLLEVNGSAGKPGGGSWSVASDRRLKDDIRPLQGTLDRLLQLHGVTFRYKDPAAIHQLPGTQTGMVAQDVQPVFPDWVDQDASGYKRLTYRGFEALTVEALRDLRTEKDGQIQALREENRRLHDRLDVLEQAVADLIAKAER